MLRHQIELSSNVGRASRFAIVAPRASPRVERALRHRVAANPGAVPAANALAGALVAVVDDDPAAVDAMRALFATWGAEVAGGGDAATVLAVCGELGRYPNLLLADLRLGKGVCGVDVVARLRNELGIAVPALVVTGDTGPAAERRVRDAGLTMMQKPVVAAKLAEAARALLEPAKSAVDA